MKKIKYQGGITKLITSTIAKSNKQKFTILISKTESLRALVTQVNSRNNVNVNIVSFSSSFDFSEQILSILSYIKYVGIPVSWFIYSDGTHSSEQIKLLETAISFVKIIKPDLLKQVERSNKLKDSLSPWQKELLHYANSKPLGKKLFYYLNHTVKAPTLFIDSDVLFYNKANVLLSQLNQQNNGYFLPDVVWGNLDSRYMLKNSPELYQVNSGFIVMNKELPTIDKGLNYLKSLNGNYEYFTEQTIFHVLLTGNNFIPLDPRVCILDTVDQFDFSYLYAKEKMAIRHYTSPVRHKMWQNNWKWHLSI